VKPSPQTNAILAAALILMLAGGVVAVSFLDASSHLSGWIAFGEVIPLQVLLVLGFSIHAIKYSGLSGKSGWLWVVAFFACSLVFMPIYWFRYIWPLRLRA
jgi:hypothetical protein